MSNRDIKFCVSRYTIWMTVTDAILHVIWDERLNTFETFKEQHEALLPSVPPWIQKSRQYDGKIINMDVLYRHLQRKIKEPMHFSTVVILDLSLYSKPRLSWPHWCTGNWEAFVLLVKRKFTYIYRDVKTVWKYKRLKYGIPLIAIKLLDLFNSELLAKVVKVSHGVV